MRHPEYLTFAMPSAIICALVPGAPTVQAEMVYMTIDEAMHAAFPNMTEYLLRELALTPEQADSISTKLEISVPKKKKWKIWDIHRESELLGYLVFDQVVGKHLLIDYSIALSADNTIKRVDILTYRENYGAQIHEPGWLSQFVGKTNNDELELGKTVRVISGATISCRSISQGVKILLAALPSVAENHS